MNKENVSFNYMSGMKHEHCSKVLPEQHERCILITGCNNAGSIGEFGSLIPIPWTFRLIGAAVLLVLVRTRSGRALAATIAIPAFYWGSLVILIAPVAILIRDRLARRESADGSAAKASPNLKIAPL